MEFKKKPIVTNFETSEKKNIYHDKLRMLINLSKLNLKEIKLDDYSKSINYLENRLFYDKPI